MAEAEKKPNTVIAVVDLEEADGLLVENAQLKLVMAARDMEQARRAYATEMRNQATVTTRIGEKYGVDATQYDFDPETKKLRLRQRQAPGMPPVAPTPIIPPDAGGQGG